MIPIYEFCIAITLPSAFITSFCCICGKSCCRYIIKSIDNLMYCYNNYQDLLKISPVELDANLVDNVVYLNIINTEDNPTNLDNKENVDKYPEICVVAIPVQS